MGRRISKNQLTVNNLNQVIINKKYPLSKLIVSDHDHFNFHIGRKHTHAVIRKQYWIPSCRGLIRTVLNECLHCKKMSAKPRNPLTSDLPKERFTINEKPFSKTGINYFGPIYVKHRKELDQLKEIKKDMGYYSHV